MNLENIIEKRNNHEGKHSLVLEISVNEYRRDYDQYNDDIASNILHEHLQNRGDDGRPSDIKIHPNDKDNIVRITANVDYLGNDHTRYIF